MKNIRMTGDVIDLLAERGFQIGFRDKHGIKVMKKSGTYVSVRSSGGLRVANSSMAFEHVTGDLTELVAALRDLQTICDIVSDKVREMANVFLEYFAARRVPLMTNLKQPGIYEFYTTGTTSSIRLFSLVGERLDNSNDVEIDFHAASAATGPILDIETFESALPTLFSRPEHVDRYPLQNVTLDTVDLFIPEMLERGLSDVTLLTYKTSQTTDVGILKGLVERLPSSDVQTAYHINFHDRVEV